MCKGRGQLRYQQGFLTVARTCGQCMGEGQIIKSPCKVCSGEGRIAQERTLKVRIPPGVDEGAQLRVTGEGEGGVAGGPPGDLYVVLHVKQHPFFTRQGNDLYCALPLTFAQAALGAEVDVPILNGVAQLKVHAGTQNGDVLRLRGKGMPSLHARGRGDACYSVVVEVPRKLTSKQRELLEEYQRVSSGEEQGPLVGGFLESLKKLRRLTAGLAARNSAQLTRAPGRRPFGLSCDARGRGAEFGQPGVSTSACPKLALSARGIHAFPWDQLARGALLRQSGVLASPAGTPDMQPGLLAGAPRRCEGRAPRARRPTASLDRLTPGRPGCPPLSQFARVPALPLHPLRPGR
jgi:hypothetical protein